ncbi:MAG: Xaa-Pro peptidase family protein [Alicyclobacillus sp.]|nr:Xaa-Pro peptidase family protein [Alicyclobacillus sp.]
MEPLVITREERAARRARVLASMQERSLDAAVIFSPTSIFYLIGFHFIPTERPMAMILRASDTTLFVPRLEHEHAEQVSDALRVVSYPEYPSPVHPMQRLAELLKELGLANARLGVDSDGYGSSWGYRGPRLSQVVEGATVVPEVGAWIEEMRMCKSPAELALIRESCRWGNLAHVLLQRYSKPGAREIDISMRATQEATAAMIDTLGPIYRPAGSASASAGFRGQIGPNSALPHAVTVNATLRAGDTLVTGAGADIYGYHSELERTMFVGEPNAEQRRFFELMLGAQNLAISLIRPGIPCKEVEQEMQRYYQEHDIVAYTRHHTGHNIGLQGHEMPFLDLGDDTILQPGMLFTIEPGLYVNGLGGFRHSDTVVVTETGVEVLTYYPRNLDALICG